MARRIQVSPPGDAAVPLSRRQAAGELGAGRSSPVVQLLPGARGAGGRGEADWLAARSRLQVLAGK